MVLIAAMRHGATPRRVRESSRWVGGPTNDRSMADLLATLPPDVVLEVSRAASSRLIEMLPLPRSLMDVFLVPMRRKKIGEIS